MRKTFSSICRAVVQFAQNLLYRRYVLLSAVFVVGVVIGVVAKTIAQKTITIGYNDYLIAPSTRYINLNDVAQKLANTSDVSIKQNSMSSNDSCIRK